jgi:hypothetical protein
MKYLLFFTVGSTLLLLSYFAMLATFEIWLYFADFIK